MVRSFPILPAVLLAVASIPSSATAVQEFACAGFEPPVSLAGVAGKTTGIDFRAPSSRGAVHALVVSAKFRGEQPSVTAATDFADRLFDPDLAGSLTHFYTTMSSGQFELSGTALPRRYESQESASAYLENTPGELGQFGRFASEILEAIDGDIDFGQFDNDGPDGVPNSGDDDGFVDYIFINVLSTPQGFIIGGATGVAGFQFVDARSIETKDPGANGSRILVSSGQAAGSISREGTYDQTVGSMAHEFGHALDLPDLYDKEYTGGEDDSAGIGRWGLMGWGALGWNGTEGPNPFSAWSLEQLGWIGVDNERLVEVSGEHKIAAFTPLGEGGHVYKLATRNPFEYFLVEHRRPVTNYYERNLQGVDAIVLGLAAVHRLQIERVSEHETNALTVTQVRQPVPGEDALHANDQVVSVGLDGSEELVGIRAHVAM